MSPLLRGAVVVSGAFASQEPVLNVVSYNMYWWHTRDNSLWDSIYGRLNSSEPFDIIGFQETDDVVAVLDGIGLSSWEKHHDYHIAACPIAWNPDVFDTVGGPAHVKVSQDAWERQLVWVRLRHRATTTVLFWANTHGPLGCEDNFGRNIVDAIRANSRAGDHIVMTGDFNCDAGKKSMRDVMGFLPHSVHGTFPDGGVDHILSKDLQILRGGPHNGYPSDHPLMKATLRLPTGPAPPLPPAPPPAPPPTPPVPAPTPIPAGSWAVCTAAGPCCDPYSVVRQFCLVGYVACQECGGGLACQCPVAYSSNFSAVLAPTALMV